MSGSYTERFTEVHVPLAVQAPDGYAAGAHPTGWVNMERYHRAILVLNVGGMQQGATLDAALQQATDVAGTGAKAIAGKAITQLAQTGGDGDDLVAIELRTEELDVNGGFSFVRVNPVVGVDVVVYSLILWGITSRYNPVPVTDWTEIIP